jgi:phenylpropionate dioxygenase-like ring-hydroxylating dioxygenase large terminal subunit
VACASRDLRAGPIGHRLGEQRFVAFRDELGRAVVLDGRCSHMRADLSKGCVRDGVIHCPLHDWRYAGDGRCVHIPASDTIPPFARQVAYPTAEIGGQVVFFNAPLADFPMPFFDERSPDELCPAEPFDIELECPWYLVGANGFDVQHFRVAHDRTLIDSPHVDSPHPFAQRMTATYDVAGGGVRDGLIRKFAGRTVRMSVTSWAGVNILVTATFDRTRTHGMVFVQPLDENRTLLKTIVWIPRHHGPLARGLIDPLAAAIRRKFIQAFLNDDAVRSDGARYNPATLIDADREMKRYLEWLGSLASLSSKQSVDVAVSVAPHITRAATGAVQEGAV